MIEKTSFGQTPGGHETCAYTLSSANARVRVCDFGATLLGIEFAGRDGSVADVVLGYDSVAGYAGVNGACYGGTIGPVANRTDRAEVPIEGVVYHLPGNDGPNSENNLHSDLGHGLHKRIWDASVDEATNSVTFICTLDDLELGLPGNRTFSVTYALADEGDEAVLTLTQSCTTDAPTYVNMTNHAYFNLSGHGSGSVHDQLVEIDTDAFLPVREDSVSEGEIRPVEGTPFDFREAKALGRDIAEDEVQLDRARGYDHCFCIRGYEPGAAPRHALSALDPASGRRLDILVTSPGAHLYTGNWLDDATGVKDGATYVPRSGFAFEPEFYPDCVHHPDWPQSVCAPGKPYVSTIVYRLSLS